ncbi:MAG: hypothetical protein R3E97_20270 [Candidatus Eisenbacteria bacterium]
MEGRFRTLIRIAATVLLAVGASGARAGDELEPPTEKDYYCQVVDLRTGAPVEGVWIEAHEEIDWFQCATYQNGSCYDCYADDRTQSAHGVSDASGRVHVVFPLPFCEPLSDDPPLWEKRIHQSWGDPELWGPGQSETDPWVVGRVERVTGSNIMHRLHLIRESDIIEMFAPVLHGHRGRELQEGLADLVRSVDDHSTLEAYSVTGQRIHQSDPPALHVFDDHFWDSYGSGTQQPYFRLDFADSVLHRGAPNGERPLYAHVFPYGDGLVLQYWLWLQGNDLRELPGQIGYHEGDWEYLALYLELGDDDVWTPRQINLSQHAGGLSLGPAECWWSETNEPTYLGMQQGYDPAHPHLHVWVAANSHALYNRYAPVYGVSIDIPVLCEVAYADRVDYGRADHPFGDHAFFEYDRLENAGEFETVGTMHGESYLWHWSGGPLEYLMFVGTFGEGKCVDLPDCLDFCGMDGVGYTYQAPKSPLLDSAVHNWDSFHMPSGRWGNPDPSFGSVSWSTYYMLGDYLGRFATCEDGRGDVIDLPIPAIHGDVPATAKFTVISGDVSILDADPNGEIPLGSPENAAYRLQLSRVSGEGEVSLDVDTTTGLPLADDARFEIAPGGCLDPADVPGEGDATGGDGPDVSNLPAVAQAAASIRILGNPSRYGFHVDLGAAPHPWSSWSLHDSAGRKIAQGRLDPHFREIAWSSEADEPLHPGRYFLRLRSWTGASRSKSLTVVR